MTVKRATTTVCIGCVVGWLFSLAAMYVILGYLGEELPGLRELRMT